MQSQYLQGIMMIFTISDPKKNKAKTKPIQTQTPAFGRNLEERSTEYDLKKQSQFAGV